MKRKIKARQIIALSGVVILAGLYIASLVLALCKSEIAFNFFKLSLFCTMIIPVMIYFILMFFKLGKNNSLPEEKVYADEKDDPFTEEDFKDE